MLTYQDEKRVREIVREETNDIRHTVNSTAIDVDKVLQIVTRIDQEHTLTQAKVTQHEKRITKIEKKIKLKSPASSSVFA